MIEAMPRLSRWHTVSSVDSQDTYCSSLTSVGRVEGVCRRNLLVVWRQPRLVDKLVVVDALDSVPGDGLHNDQDDPIQSYQHSAVTPEGSLRGDIPVVLNIVRRVKQSSCGYH